MRFAFRHAVLLAFFGFAATYAFAQTIELPHAVETPPARPPSAIAEQQRSAGDVPLPSPRPEHDETKGDDANSAPAPSQSLAALPREEAFCRQRLRALGVTFRPHPPLSDPSGCAVPHPVVVTGLPDGVELTPEAVLNCATAEATARIVRDVVAPQARESFGSPLALVRHASAYVCRPRAGQSELSEHAFGNALDWAELVLKDGTVIDVRGYGRAHQRRSEFLAGIRDAACGPFKTVLGPGTDADHADHFHFDLAERRNGGTYCR